ncbi:MAG: hypothetical protein QNL33_04025 [Akkermansiaceae bacterium]
MHATWNSKPGAAYSIYYDNDLEGFELELNDEVLSAGETTTYNFNRATIGGASATRVFFRIEEIQ